MIFAIASTVDLNGLIDELQDLTDAPVTTSAGRGERVVGEAFSAACKAATQGFPRNTTYT